MGLESIEFGEQNGGPRAEATAREASATAEARSFAELLREQQERFEFATAAADIGYWFCDLPFDKLIWDERVKAHFWLPAEAEVDIGLFYAQLHPEDRERTRLAVERSIADHTRYEIEYRTVSSGGEIKWIQAVGRTAYDAAGNPVRFDGVTREITALKLAREALLRSEKLAIVGRLAATISHEINNPLESVTNLLYLICQGAEDEVARGYCELAEQELARVSHIVTQTLQFNRQRQGAARERVSSLIDSALAIYEPRIRSSGSTVERSYDDRDAVLCMPSELRQVFANLIGNAFDASRSGGRLILRTRSRMHEGIRQVCVTIADTGSGMDGLTQQRLFEPFFTTKGESGTGLGLWITREILKKHGATVKVRSSQTPGRSGTVFMICLRADPPLEDRSGIDA